MTSFGELSGQLPSMQSTLGALSIQTGSTSEGALDPSPIKPEWILEGTPVARARTLTRAGDGRFSCALWDCTAGRFNWFFGCDEIVHILEGEVTVREPGAEYTLRPGDVAYFPAGSTSTWTVSRYVKKFAIHRSVAPTLLRRIRGRIGRIVRSVLPRT